MLLFQGEKMKKLQVLIPIMLAFSFLAACGTITVDSLHPVVRSADLGKEKTIVILPFADYTPTDTPAAYWRRNMLIMEALQDEIIRFGYAPAVSEDVIAYLSRRNIIRPDARFEEESTANAVLRAELGKDWSDSMKIEIAKALQSNLTMARQTVATNKNEPPKSIALDHSEIQKIGSAFNAHYVVRGRIMVFENGREDSFNPLQTGVLPFFFNFSSRTLFGIAESEKYEMIDKMAIGGLLGAALALDDWPKNDETITTMSEGHPRFEGGFITETVADTNFNRAVWGVAGAGLGYLAHQGGRVDNATVQLRMIVQDTTTGEIVWTNRAEAKTMTQSAFSKKDPDVLMASAIQQVCQRLFDNFVATDADRRIVRMYDDGTLYVTPAGGLNAHVDPMDPVYVDSPAAVSDKRGKLLPESTR
jgi:hypothetical protein